MRLDISVQTAVKFHGMTYLNNYFRLHVCLYFRVSVVGWVVVRFPLTLDCNFQHSTERPVLITDQPYMFIFPQLLPKLPTEPIKIGHFQNSESIFEETIDLIFLKMIFS